MMRSSNTAVACAVLFGLLAGVGCQSGQSIESQKARTTPIVQTKLNAQLVMPGNALLELAGPQAWPAGEMDLLNHRRNESLGADRMPIMASVNRAEVRVWDQQWIINGRSMETYLRSTRSIQSSDLP